MVSIQFHTSFLANKKYLLLLFGLFSIIFLVNVAFVQTVNAEPTIVSEVQAYCKQVVPKKAVKACAGTNNINVLHARNAATYHCKAEPTAGNLKEDCITRQAKLFIKIAAAKNPQSVRSFEASLNKILAADVKITGGTVDDYSPDSGPIVTTSTATIHQSPIQPSGLPKPSTNAGTIKTIFGIVFGIIGAFALLMITISGLKYVTAGGDPQQASEARKGIVYSLIGLAIAVSAEAIVVFLVNEVG